MQERTSAGRSFAAHTKGQSIAEMRHARPSPADPVPRRLPNYQRLFNVSIGQTVVEMSAPTMQVDVERSTARRRHHVMREVGGPHEGERLVRGQSSPTREGQVDYPRDQLLLIEKPGEPAIPGSVDRNSPQDEFDPDQPEQVTYQPSSCSRWSSIPK